MPIRPRTARRSIAAVTTIVYDNEGQTGSRWTWGTAKNQANLRDHRINFDAAILVFNDPLAATWEDPFQSAWRFRTVGMVGTQIVMVVHTWPELDTVTGEEVGRIISARKATRREREAYEEGYI